MAWNSDSGFEYWMMEKLAGLGSTATQGAEISPVKRDLQRRTFREPILRTVFEAAVRRLTPTLPDGAVQKVMARVTDEVFAGDLMAGNRCLHGLITGGLPITHFSQGKERRERTYLAEAGPCRCHGQAGGIGRGQHAVCRNRAIGTACLTLGR